MSDVTLQGLTKRFGRTVAVDRVDAEFEEGSFTTLLGPSGCGKTTILRMIAGLEAPSAGDIMIGERRINDVPIHKRNLGVVFQNYALFPHKTVGENVVFGLKYRGISREDATRKLREALEVVRLPGMEDRFPSQLSGGQQQRIALARAIVIEPTVLLLDEPLSALDANLREEMRVELKSIQQRIGVTSVFVTHDQSEALAMSDKVLVMRDGRVEQVGTPSSVYNRPASLFVATFLGASNILDARVSAVDGTQARIDAPGFGEVTLPRDQAARLDEGAQAKFVVRAEKLSLHRPGSVNGAATVAKARVEAIDYQGQVARYFVRLGDLRLQVIGLIEGDPFPVGEEVDLKLSVGECTALPPETERRDAT
ncbi:MAG: ABC transporter ATP-binding protein [Pseudomonadota bacterium]